MKSAVRITLAVVAMALPSASVFGQGEAIPLTRPPANTGSSTPESGKAAATQQTKVAEPKLRVMISAAAAADIFKPVQASGGGATSMVQETIQRDVTLIIDCDQISLQVTADDKGVPTYSFNTTGPVMITGQQMSLRGEDAVMENGKLIVKNAVVTSSIAKMQSAELILEISANSVSVNRWSPGNPLPASTSASGAPVVSPYYPGSEPSSGRGGPIPTGGR
jgi:hypothetical protein